MVADRRDNPNDLKIMNMLLRNITILALAATPFASCGADDGN